MSKTGNNTLNRQYIYCLIHFPLIAIFKIGVTGNMRARLVEINKTTFGFCLPVFFCKVWAAFYIEQFILGLLRPLKFELSGSGGSEWRFFGIVALPIILAAYLIDKMWLLFVSLFICWILAGCPHEVIKSLSRLF